MKRFTSIPNQGDLKLINSGFSSIITARVEQNAQQTLEQNRQIQSLIFVQKVKYEKKSGNNTQKIKKITQI